MSELRFTVDRTLGKLSKWLRILGFDTQFAASTDPAFLLVRLPADRILLTRTRRMRESASAKRLVVVEQDRVMAQLRELIEALGIRPDDVKPFCRCLHCNDLIQPIGKQSVYERVPDHVWETHATFTQCPACQRIFWPGSHTVRTLEMINGLFEEKEKGR